MTQSSNQDTLSDLKGFGKEMKPKGAESIYVDERGRWNTYLFDINKLAKYVDQAINSAKAEAVETEFNNLGSVFLTTDSDTIDTKDLDEYYQHRLASLKEDKESSDEKIQD